MTGARNDLVTPDHREDLPQPRRHFDFQFEHVHTILAFRQMFRSPLLPLIRLGCAGVDRRIHQRQVECQSRSVSHREAPTQRSGGDHAEITPKHVWRDVAGRLRRARRARERSTKLKTRCQSCCRPGARLAVEAEIGRNMQLDVGIAIALVSADLCRSNGPSDTSANHS